MLEVAQAIQAQRDNRSASGTPSRTNQGQPMSGTFNLASAFEAAGVAAITAGLTNGITYSSQGGVGFTTQPLALGGPTSSLAMLAGVSPAIGTTANQAMGTTATLGTRALAMLAEAGISSTVSTAIEGGSFGNAFKNAFVGELAAAAAYKIGDLANENGSLIPENSPQYILTHALVGCAASAAEGTGCAGGAIGGAAGAALSPLLLGTIDPNHDPLTTGQTAALGAFATLVGGLSAGLAGANAQAGAQAGQNVALNNDAPHWGQLTSQAGTGLLGQRSGSTNGLTGNPLTDPAAVACAGGTQACDMQLFQTLSQARGANADQALGTMNSAAPYVGGALAVTLGGVLFGPTRLAGGSEAFAAYRAGQAGYSLTTAATTGSAVGAGLYTGGAAAGAGIDYFKGGSFADSFNQRFSFAGLAAATTISAANTAFSTSMFSWAGVPNTIWNIATLPGFMIRLNSFLMGKAVGSSAQAAVKNK